MSEWLVSIRACRASHVLLVVSTTTGVYRVYDTQFGDGANVDDVLGLPSGGSIQIAWVPQPGSGGLAEGEGRAAGNLGVFTAVGAMGTLYMKPSFSVIPGTEAVWQQPVSDAAGGFKVYPGTVATYEAIGVA